MKTNQSGLYEKWRHLFLFSATKVCVKYIVRKIDNHLFIVVTQIIISEKEMGKGMSN
jgi:hypothetical protein